MQKWLEGSAVALSLGGAQHCPTLTSVGVSEQGWERLSLRKEADRKFSWGLSHGI